MTIQVYCGKGVPHGNIKSRGKDLLRLYQERNQIISKHTSWKTCKLSKLCSSISHQGIHLEMPPEKSCSKGCGNAHKYTYHSLKKIYNITAKMKT